jgi:hypothetical protein
MPQLVPSLEQLHAATPFINRLGLEDLGDRHGPMPTHNAGRAPCLPTSAKHLIQTSSTQGRRMCRRRSASAFGWSRAERPRSRCDQPCSWPPRRLGAFLLQAQVGSLFTDGASCSPHRRHRFPSLGEANRCSTGCNSSIVRTTSFVKCEPTPKAPESHCSTEAQTGRVRPTASGCACSTITGVAPFRGISGASFSPESRGIA